MAFCPHPEHSNTKSPAWFIRDDKGSPYHATHCCKSCGFQGGTLSLIEVVLGLDREAAIEWLNDLSGPVQTPLRLEIEVREFRAHTWGMGPVDALEIDFHPEDFDPLALNYLRDRRVTLEQVDRWGIGSVAPKAKIGLKRHPLRGRIVVPIKNKWGRWLAYTARDFTDTSVRKYMEPSREENPSHSALFGEQFWGDRKVCVVCEGVFDGLAVERVVPSAVTFAALRGSDPDPSKLCKLLDFQKIVVATDNDPPLVTGKPGAGNRVAQEIRLLLGSHLEVVRACPPQGRDLAAMEETERQDFLGGIIGF